jgi:hypothetical protein
LFVSLAALILLIVQDRNYYHCYLLHCFLQHMLKQSEKI